MEEKEIIKILLESRKSIKVYKKLSVKNLCDIMIFFETNFKTKKHNWSIKLYNIFIEEKLNENSLDLGLFYKEYVSRKKQNKKFGKFISLVYLQRRNEYERLTRKKIQIISKDKTKDFIKEMQRIKHKYLLGSDADLIKIISDNFETGYSESTIRFHFYQQNKL